MTPCHWIPLKAVFRANFVLKKGIAYLLPKESLFEYKEKLAKEHMIICHMDVRNILLLPIAWFVAGICREI